jgi:hypothetical protein
MTHLHYKLLSELSLLVCPCRCEDKDHDMSSCRWSKWSWDRTLWSYNRTNWYWGLQYPGLWSEVYHDIIPIHASGKSPALAVEPRFRDWDIRLKDPFPLKKILLGKKKIVKCGQPHKSLKLKMFNFWQWYFRRIFCPWNIFLSGNGP